jgi:uncharacterized membrane protein
VARFKRAKIFSAISGFIRRPLRVAPHKRTAAVTVQEYSCLINGFDRRPPSTYLKDMSTLDQSSDRPHEQAAPTSGPIMFDATLRPHRSLEPRGFALLMAAIAGVSFISGLAFALHGAWPVMGFFGLDVAIIYIAFRANYRAADSSERIALSETELTVERYRQGRLIGRWAFQPYWLRINVTDGPQPGVVLHSHGRSISIGSFLSPDERVGFAQALSQSINELRLAPHLRS